MDAFGNVYPTLLGCFGTILIGYLCGRANLISGSQGKGLELYIARIALPALLFKSLIELDFSKVDWNFWFGILLSKVVLFVIVAGIALIVTQPMSENLGKAGLFGIFVTQSNDLALGLPLFDAIFKETHPEYIQYLYLLIPVSVSLLNPIGFLMLEFHQSSKMKRSSTNKLQIVWKAVKGVITNPLVFMVILGLIFNFILDGTKQYTGFNKDHWFLTPFLSVIGNSFGATALFYLGLKLVGNMNKYTGYTLVVPFLLVCCKSLIFPVIARQAVFWLSNNSSTSSQLNTTCLSSFAFIYGTLPTAPPVAVYATMYGVEVDTIGTSMVLGTFLSAPIMFVSSKMIIVMRSEASEINVGFHKALFDTGILSAVCCIWVFVVFLTTKYYKRFLHQCTLVLVAFQFTLSMAILINKTVVNSKVLLAFFIIGLFGSTIWTALVSFSLAAVRCKGEKFASKTRFFTFCIGICLPVVIGISLSLTEDHSELGRRRDPANFTQMMDNSFLQYIRDNKALSWIHGITQVISVIVCVLCLIVVQRCDKYCRCRELSGSSEKQPLIEKTARNQDVEKTCKPCRALCKKEGDIEDLACDSHCRESDAEQIQARSCLPEQKESENLITWKERASERKSYRAISTSDDVQFDELKDIEEINMEEYLNGDRHQLIRHVILILFLCLFSVLNIFLCFERVKNDDQAHKAGVFLEIEFLAVTCTIAQGFVSFAAFGFNKIFFNFISFERFGILQPSCIAKKIKLVPFRYLDTEIKEICSKFRAHHLESCQRDLVSDQKFHFKSYKNVFRGNQMIDWILDFGLANTRMDAVFYGNCLLRGRIIQHCVNEHFFYDLPYFYRFCDETVSTDISDENDK